MIQVNILIVWGNETNLDRYNNELEERIKKRTP